MKLHFTNDWLKETILTDPDTDPEAGFPLTVESPASVEADAGKVVALGSRTAVQLRIGLGVLVRQLRHRDGLSISVLAERAQVSEDELKQVEHDPHYTARPRLIFQLSAYFGVPLAKLSQMAGATQMVDRGFYNDVVKYAAHSDDVSALTDEERSALDAFVGLLKEKA